MREGGGKRFISSAAPVWDSKHILMTRALVCSHATHGAAASNAKRKHRRDQPALIVHLYIEARMVDVKLFGAAITDVDTNSPICRVAYNFYCVSATMYFREFQGETRVHRR